jgi:hypothetical protein
MAFFPSVEGSMTSEDSHTFMVHVKRPAGGDLLLGFPHSETPNNVENAAIQAAHRRNAKGQQTVAACKTSSFKIGRGPGGESVRLGMRTARRMSRASKPDKQNGTLSVHTIRASGHVHRTNRANTRLHPTITPDHQINPCNAGAIHTGPSDRRHPSYPAGEWASSKTL